MGSDSKSTSDATDLELHFAAPFNANLAKLTPPRIYRTIERDRLYTLLDQLRDRPLIWIGAPAGSGKSTLISCYLSTRNLRAFWYHVDEGDKDPATFYHYLSALLGSSPAEAPPRLLIDDLVAFARRQIRELFQKLGSGFMLVFDNCHKAACDSFHTVLQVALEELPHHSCIFIISRSLPPAQFSREVIHDLIAQVVWSDLRVDENEAAQLGRLRGESDPRRILAANRLCDGWMIGLLMALQSDGVSRDAQHTMLSHGRLFEYLMREQFASVEPNVQSTLLRCSLLPDFTVEMAHDMTGQSHVKDVLDLFYQNQCFISRSTNSRPRYRFHDLFREFLVAVLTDRTSADELDSLWMKAGQLLESDANPAGAIDAFREAKAWSDVARIIVSHAVNAFYQGRWQTIQDWISMIPKKFIATDRWLIYWRARSLTTRDTRSARRDLEVALVRFIESGDDMGVFAAAMPLWETVILLGEPWTAYGTWLPALERSLERAGNESNEWLVIEAWEAYLLMSLLLSGRGALLDDAQAIMLRTLVDRTLNCNERIAIANDAAILGWLSSDAILLGRAIQTIEEIVLRNMEQQEDLQNLSPLLRHWGHYWRALASWCIGKSDVAIASFSEAILLASKVQITTTDLSAYCYLSMAYHESGRMDKAAAILSEARIQLDPQRPFHWGMYHLALAFDAYRTGNLAQALLYQRDCVASLQRVGGLSMLAMAWAAEAAYLCQMDRLDEAEALCDHAEAALAETVYRFVDAILLLVRCELARRRGMHQTACRLLHRALGAARDPIQVGMLFSLTNCLPNLVELAIGEGMADEGLRLIIDRWKVRCVMANGEQRLWPVQVHTLGDFRIMLGERSLGRIGRPQFKVIALLKAIIAAGGRHVRCLQIEEWLWPDAEGDASARNLKVTLHRLRKLLGRDDAVILSDGCLSLNDNVCWIDLWRFESGSDDEIIALYRGPFLIEEGTKWVVSTRERLAARFQRSALASGDRLESGGKFLEATQLYERCIAVEPYCEAFYRQLMIALKAAGRYSHAADAYRRCRRTMGAQLSRETLNVYESIAIDIANQK